jgi:hypothetical protein
MKNVWYEHWEGIATVKNTRDPETGAVRVEEVDFEDLPPETQQEVRDSLQRQIRRLYDT